MAITVDATLSTTSTNPVENKAITNALNTKADTSSLPHGVPSGGTTGQVLVKSSNSDYAVEWQTVTTPSGTKSISITSNGTTTEDVTNYATASITTNVPASAVDSGTKNISITQNGTTTENVVGYASASISVNVSGGDTLDTFLNNTITSYKYLQTSQHKNAWRYCSSVQTLVYPNLSGNIGNSYYAFADCAALTNVDLGANVSSLGSYNFLNDSSLSVLILRRTSIVAIANANTFNGSSLASGGSGCTIYIPKVLYDHLGDDSTSDYQKASNWSTIYGYGTITWAKIEGSTYETHYADGSLIS